MCLTSDVSVAGVRWLPDWRKVGCRTRLLHLRSDALSANPLSDHRGTKQRRNAAAAGPLLNSWAEFLVFA
jgi:hypothetical protein